MQENQIDILEEIESVFFDNVQNNTNINKNLNEEIVFENILNDFDSINTNDKPIKKNRFLKVFGGLMFLLKYALTSTLIFGILLITTNYSAYFNIVKSYFYEEQLEIESKGIISSVEASNLKEKFNKQIKEEKQLIKNEGNEKTTDFSIRKLVNISNKNDISLDIEIIPYENRIIIPKIGKNIPLVDIVNKKIDGYNELNNIFMKELENGVLRYPGSAKPGENGTTFIFGHSSNFPWIKGNYNDVFALLDKVGYDDEIIIYYNQEKFKYRIKEKKVIVPGDVSVLERNKDKSELTLMTCWPIGTTLNRLIVVGEIIKE